MLKQQILKYRKVLSQKLKINTQIKTKQKRDNNHFNSQNNVQVDQSSFNHAFDVMNEIGQGTHAVVKLCRQKKTQKQFAVKIIRSNDQEMIRIIKRTFNNMKKIQSDKVIKAHKLYIEECKCRIFLVMEYCDYPTLEQYINRYYQFNIEECKIVTNSNQIIFEILTAIKIIHKSGIAHRDLKPQNILYNKEDKSIKIIDFGISKNFWKNFYKEDMWTVTGTLHYKAPQMFSGSYDEKVDLWAVGIIFYRLILKKFPFNSEYLLDTIQSIVKDELDLSNQGIIPTIAKDLIYRLLKKDPSKRLSAKQALNHHWFLLDTFRSQNNFLFNSYKEQGSKFQQNSSLRYSKEIKQTCNHDYWLLDKSIDSEQEEKVNNQ